MTKIAFSKAKKIAMKFFGSEMTPPPFGNFPEIHRFSYAQASLTIWCQETPIDLLDYNATHQPVRIHKNTFSLENVWMQIYLVE